MNHCCFRAIPDHHFQQDDGMTLLETVCKLNCVTIGYAQCGTPSGHERWCPQHSAVHRNRHTEYHQLSDFNRDNDGTIFRMAQICRDVQGLPDEIRTTDFQEVNLHNGLPQRIQQCEDVIATLDPLL